ncbi:MAG: DUF2971 domain-containing protein [Roseiarcus sp.]|jgi:hypothetical protein
MAVDMDIPQQVTRFYGTVDYAMDVVANRQIAFVHVSMLNDPFDPYCFFETDFGESYPNLIAFMKKNHPGDLPWFRANVPPISWGQTVRDLKAYMQRVRETAFIFSTSTTYYALHPKDNLYMWGHYANGHRGVAIEFNTQALATAVIKHHEAENGKPPEATDVWAEIEYTKTFGPITAEYVYEFMKQEKDISNRKRTIRSTTQLDMYYARLPRIKSDVWQSENEWRLMWQSEKTTGKIYKCPIPEDAITTIFLGLNLAPDKAEEILAVAKLNFPRTSIFRAHKRHGALALEFELR